MKIVKITQTGRKSNLEVSEALFNKEVSQSLVAQAVRVFLANQRRAHAKTKTRSAVKRTKAKWYKQKGTGNARHGSKNAPLFVGGGVAHGPTGQENWSLKLNKRLKQQAFRMALTANRAAIVVSDLPLTLRKTKDALKFINLIVQKPQARVLLVVGQKEVRAKLAFRNLPNVLIETPEKLTTYQVALADKLCFSTEAIASLSQRLQQQQVAAKSLRIMENKKSQPAKKASPATNSQIHQQKKVSKTVSNKRIKQS